MSYSLPTTGTSPNKYSTKEAHDAAINEQLSRLSDLISTITTGNKAAGDWDPSTDVFPSSSVRGTFYNVISSGVVDGEPFVATDYLYPIVDNADTGIYSGNWSKSPNGALVGDLYDILSESPVSFPTVASMLADSKTVADYQTRYGRSTGIINFIVLDGLMMYSVDLEQLATSHLTTTGGVGIRILASDIGYNARSGGALGNGSADDTLALSLVVSVAQGSGLNTTVAFPEHADSVYMISSEINVSRVSITAPVGRITIKSNGVAESHMFRIDAIIGGVATSFGDAKVTIENILFDCSSETGGIYVGVRHHKILNCFFKDFDLNLDTTGIYAERNTQEIEGCWFAGSLLAPGSRKGIGVFLDGQTNATVAASKIINCHFADCVHNIKLNEALALLVQDCVLQSADAGEVIIENILSNRDIDGLKFKDCYFENQEDGFQQFIHVNPNNVNDLESITVTGCTFFGGNQVGAVAMRFEGVEIVNLRDNFFRALTYCASFTLNFSGTSGVFEGNVLSTNVLGFVDPLDVQDMAAARKFRFGKNKGWNVRDTFSKTILSGTTSVTFTHGLDILPEDFILMRRETSPAVIAQGELYVGNGDITDTEITVRLDSTPVSNIAFSITAFFGDL